MIILIFLIFTFPILSKPEYSLETILLRQEGSFSGKTEKETEYVSESDILLVPNFYYSEEDKERSFDLSFQLVKRGKQSDANQFFWAGKNLYYSRNFSTFSVFLGRKQDSIYDTIFNSYYDGLEGLGIQINFSSRTRLFLSLLDYYRAFPLLEKNLFLNKKSESQKGAMWRHGLKLEYDKDSLRSLFYLNYTNTGSAGKYSNEDPLKKGRGDRDFLIHSGILLQYKRFTNFGTIDSALLFCVSRGIDKTLFHPVRKDSSLPVSGEMLSGKIEWRNPLFRISSSFYLPDADKTNAEKEILELGYTGLGTNPLSSQLLVNLLDFYPSAWITENAWEKSFSTKSARRNSFFTQLGFQVQIEEYELGVSYEHIVPQKEIASYGGGLVWNKAHYERYFLGEFTLSIGFREKKEENFYFTISYSDLKQTGGEAPIKAKGLGIKAGMRF